MTDFRPAYRAMHDSVVGLGWSSGDAVCILGTGFVLHATPEMALVLTNEHVIKSLNTTSSDERQTCAVAFQNSIKNDENGRPTPFTEIVRYRMPAWGELARRPDGPNPAVPGFKSIAEKSYVHPDIGLAIIECAHAPLQAATLELDDCPEEGLPVGILGYPLGLAISPDIPSEALQCTPVLQTGVLSAILPNRSSPHRTLLAHIYSAPGCSGSPLFDNTGKVLGVAYAIRLQRGPTIEQGESEQRLFSSQLLVVPLTELPDEFRHSLRVGAIDDLYSMIQGRAPN